MLCRGTSYIPAIIYFFPSLPLSIQNFYAHCLVLITMMKTIFTSFIVSISVFLFIFRLEISFKEALIQHLNDGMILRFFWDQDLHQTSHTVINQWFYVWYRGWWCLAHSLETVPIQLALSWIRFRVSVNEQGFSSETEGRVIAGPMLWWLWHGRLV